MDFIVDLMWLMDLFQDLFLDLEYWYFWGVSVVYADEGMEYLKLELFCKWHCFLLWLSTLWIFEFVVFEMQEVFFSKGTCKWYDVVHSHSTKSQKTGTTAKNGLKWPVFRP